MNSYQLPYSLILPKEGISICYKGFWIVKQTHCILLENYYFHDHEGNTTLEMGSTTEWTDPIVTSPNLIPWKEDHYICKV